MIRVYADPFRAADYAEHAFEGRYIDWLDRAYPAGFDRPHQSRINGELIPVAEYDRFIGPMDCVDLLLLPGDPGTAIGLAIWKAVAAAVVSAAISYVVNAIFGAKPSKPGAAGVASNAAAARSNSLGVPTNVARLGEPIPVQYGRLRFTPDLAAEPYRWYDNDDQYIGAILCLGHGEFDIHDVLISDTPIGQLASGVGAHWQFYAPGSMGVIEGATGIWEDVETSVEVSDQELQRVPSSSSSFDQAEVLTGIYLQTARTATTLAVIGQSTPLPMRAWDVGDGLTITEYRSSYGTAIGGGTSDADSTSAVSYDLVAPAAGGTVTGTISVAVTTTVDFFAGDVSVEEVVYEEIQSYSADLASIGRETWAIENATAEPSPLATLYRISRTDGGVEVATSAARTTPAFAAVGPGRKARGVQVDIECPGGLYRINESTGAMMGETVTFAVTIYEIDDNGNTLSTLLTDTSGNFAASSNDPMRRTYTYVIDPPARVAVSVARTNNPSTKANDVSATYWTQLRGIRAFTSGPVYGNVTLLAVKLRATDGISSGAANLISVDCTRKLGGVATSNPAIALRDAWTSTVYGGRRALAEFDTDAVDAMETAAAAANGFNARFTSQRSLWSALQAIIRPIDYFPVPLGAQISVAHDGAKAADVMAFTSANMTDVTRLCSWDRADQTDGFEVTYTDPTTGAEAVTYYPASSVDPDSVDLEGCTDADTADDFARGLWLRQQYRREYLTWTTELGGHLAPIGERVSVAYPLVGSASYIVQSAESVDEHRVRLTGWRYDARQYA